MRKTFTVFIVIIRPFEFQFHLYQLIVPSIDTIFLLNSPVLTKFCCKVCSIAKTCNKQKAGITLKRRAFLKKNKKHDFFFPEK